MYKKDKAPVLNYHDESVMYALESFSRLEADIERIREDVYRRLKD